MATAARTVVARSQEGSTSEGRPTSLDGDGSGPGGGGGGAKARLKRLKERPPITSESSDEGGRESNKARGCQKPMLIIFDVEAAGEHDWASCHVCGMSTKFDLRLKKYLRTTQFKTAIHLKCLDEYYNLSHVKIMAAVEGAESVVGSERWSWLSPEQQEQVRNFLK